MSLYFNCYWIVVSYFVLRYPKFGNKILKSNVPNCIDCTIFFSYVSENLSETCLKPISI
jgi:hypothetical protein